MQNKQPHSDWQQENAGKNLVWFVKYWPLGCQTVKWEIIKKKKQPKSTSPQPPPNHYHQKKYYGYILSFSKTR